MPWSETVVYELHVKGISKLHPQVPRELRGTYAGLASEPIINHLSSIGVTTVELYAGPRGDGRARPLEAR